MQVARHVLGRNTANFSVGEKKVHRGLIDEVVRETDFFVLDLADVVFYRRGGTKSVNIGEPMMGL